MVFRFEVAEGRSGCLALSSSAVFGRLATTGVMGDASSEAGMEMDDCEREGDPPIEDGAAGVEDGAEVAGEGLIER